MDKICAILFPFIFLLGVPRVFDLYVDSFSITNWPLFATIIVIANILIIFSILLSDYIKKFEINSHSVQLTEIAFTAYLSTVAIEVLNLENSIIQAPLLPYPSLYVLIFGMVVTLVTTAFTAIIAKEINAKRWSDSIVNLSISYLIGLMGYSFYILLLLSNVVTK